MKLSVTCTLINIICGVVSFVYYNLMMKIMRALVLVVVISVLMVVMSGSNVRVDARAVHDYGDALTKSILFFEGQRSGKLPPSQRMKWRKDSALSDGLDVGVDLAGGYYDAGDNVKFNFPMAFSTTMLAWSVLEFGKSMGPSDLQHTLDAIRWGTDYLLKATATPGVVYVQVANAYADHNCWERPEDMDTPRTVYSVTRDKPGSEVSAEIAAALAAASILFRASDRPYATLLFQRAAKVFEFADKYRGSYSDSLGPVVCPFYCDFNGYQDELIWAAAWLHKASKGAKYWNYVTNNVPKISATFTEFGWDAKHAGINILVSKFVMNTSLNSDLFLPNADRFVCSILPESPTRSVSYSPGGLLFKPGGSNLQHVTALSFALLVYGRNLKYANKVVHCDNVVIAPSRLIRFAKIQVDYILGSNPAKMSYMVGYGPKYPQKIHHRGSTLPSVNAHPNRLKCDEGSPYFSSDKPNPNLLTGAIVGGPDINDSYEDSRVNFVQSEPTTYINAPFVGVLAYFKTRKTR